MCQTFGVKVTYRLRTVQCDPYVDMFEFNNDKKRVKI